MLVRHNVVLVFGVQGLVLGTDEDLIRAGNGAGKVLEQVCVVGLDAVDVGVAGVAGLPRSVIL